MTDVDLVRAGQSGDRAAVEALYARYLSSVWRYVCARLNGDVHAAEDVVSETFLTAVRHLRRFDPARGGVGPWLIGIARNKTNDHYRRTQRLRAVTPLAMQVRTSTGEVDPPTSVEAAETRELVAAVVDGMDDDARLALEWKYLDDLPVREIAERLGRTEKAAEALLYRARRAFRATLARYEGANDDDVT